MSLKQTRDLGAFFPAKSKQTCRLCYYANSQSATPVSSTLLKCTYTEPIKRRQHTLTYSTTGHTHLQLPSPTQPKRAHRREATSTAGPYWGSRRFLIWLAISLRCSQKPSWSLPWTYWWNRPVTMAFSVHEMALWFGSLLSQSFHQCCTLTGHSSTTDDATDIFVTQNISNIHMNVIIPSTPTPLPSHYYLFIYFIYLLLIDAVSCSKLYILKWLA
jgi:hypothetical protein